jgi:hypothetical protein
LANASGTQQFVRSESFVANCPKYATVSGPQATDSIIFESLDVLGVWTRTRPRLQAPLHACADPRPGAHLAKLPALQVSHPRLMTLAACSRRSVESCLQAGLRRIVEVRPIDLEACSSPFARERLTVHQSSVWDGAWSALTKGGSAREEPLAFHVKPGGDTRAGDRVQGSNMQPQEGAQTRVSS